ncbi:BspA family leucine-rich repeat surface protein, partial [Lactobacillus acetotolerans]
MFFTATPNNSSSDTSAQNINTANRDQANAVGKTLAPSITTTPMSDEQTAVNKAAASLQTAITQGTAYINSAAFSKMTAEKQAQLRAAMQTGKELISKYNAMQIAVNSAALDVDQNNKNKAPTNISTNLMALNAVTSNIITTANTNSTNAVITTSELAQAAHNIMLRLGSVNSNISYDAGTQTVTISAGEIDNNWLKDPSLLPDNAQVKHIKITGRVTVADGNASNLFSPYYREPMTTLQDITGLSNLDTSNITNMSGMFSFLRLTSLDVSNFDTSNVTNMSQMFENDDNLTSLDVSHFNTGKVTKMVYMFGGDSSLTSLDLSNFDTSKVTDMSNMFSGDSSLTSLDVSNLDTKNVTNMSDMFYEDSSLTSLDVSNFDTSNVTNMNEMFASVSDLTSLDVSNFDTSNVTNMGNMFGNDTALTNIIGLHNFDTSKVTDMNLMFNDDSALTSLDLSSFDTSQVTDMGDMFYGDYNLINLTGLESFNTSQVTNMSNMFDGDSGLTSLDLSSFDTSQVTDMG